MSKVHAALTRREILGVAAGTLALSALPGISRAAVSVDGRHGGAQAGWEEEGFSYSIQTAKGAATYPIPG